MGNKMKGRQSRRPTSKTKRFNGNQFTSSPVCEGSSDTESEETSATPSTVQSPGSSSSKLHNLPSWILLCSGCETCESYEDETSCPDSASSDGEEEFSSFSATSSTGNRIVNLEQLQTMFSSACLCRKCLSGELKLTETSREGLVSFIRLQCSNCSAGGV